MRRIRPTITSLRRVARDSRGTSSIEYGLILAFIVLAMFAALSQMAGTATGMWSDIDTRVRTASK